MREADGGRGELGGGDQAAEAGQASALLVGALLVGLAFAGLAIDGARLFTVRSDLQNVADSAALAGASAIDEAAYRASRGGDAHLDTARARAAAERVLAESSLPGGTAADVRVDAVHVEVHLRRAVPLTFLGIVGLPAQQIGASANAEPRTG